MDEVLPYSEVCSRSAWVGKLWTVFTPNLILLSKSSSSYSLSIRAQCYSSGGRQHNWQQLSSQTWRCQVTTVYFRLHLPIMCLGNLLHSTVNYRSWLCARTVAAQPCLLLSQRRIWCENSLIVLYQTSWACWVNGMGVLLALTSQWILKTILNL